MNRAEKQVMKRVAEVYKQYKKYDGIRAIRDFCMFSNNLSLKKEIDEAIGFDSLKDFPREDIGKE